MLILLTIINGVLIAYLFILSLRIVLGWFAPQALGRAWDLLAGATDPYLALFGRVRFLRGSLFDFSPIAAVLALVVALDLVNKLLTTAGSPSASSLLPLSPPRGRARGSSSCCFSSSDCCGPSPSFRAHPPASSRLEGGGHPHAACRRLGDEAVQARPGLGLYPASAPHYRAAVRRLASR